MLPCYKYIKYIDLNFKSLILLHSVPFNQSLYYPRLNIQWNDIRINSVY